MAEDRYSLEEIRDRLRRGKLPFSGVTELGSAAFHFQRPAPYAGVAMHAGHRVRPELLPAMAVSVKDRFREEDPYTDRFLSDLPIRIIAQDSRFEYDLNREPERAIYDAYKKTWGLHVWRRPLTREEQALSLAKHDEFHALMDIAAEYMLEQNHYVVLFDIHSYNYQRDGRRPWYEDKKPVINVGTRAVNRKLFRGLIDELIAEISKLSVHGRPISVGENVVFGGGYLSRRLSKKYFNRMLVLALEFKKIFMDEWSGRLDGVTLQILVEGFQRAATRVIKVLLNDGQWVNDIHRNSPQIY